MEEKFDACIPCFVEKYECVDTILEQNTNAKCLNYGIQKVETLK